MYLNQRPLPVRHPGGYRGRADRPPAAGQPECGAVRDGTAELPLARRQERGAPALGQDQGLPAAGVHGHLHRLDRHLDPAEL